MQGETAVLPFDGWVARRGGGTIDEEAGRPAIDADVDRFQRARASRTVRGVVVIRVIALSVYID